MKLLWWAMLNYVSMEDDSAPSGRRRSVILLHGFGASMHDLAPLADVMQVPGYSWCFPQAPIDLPGFPAGKAWFPRQEPELEHFSTGATFANLRDYDPPGLAESAREVKHLIEELALTSSELVIGGFSQGAMVAVELLTHLNALPQALVLFSGSLIAEHRWSRALSAKLQGLPVFQSHGRTDPILPYEEGTSLGRLLDKSGASRRFIDFPGGHAIPNKVVNKATQFLSDLT
ncbi:MAG: alpha/beta hydrolase [Spirochaetales bacterium]